MYALQEVWQHRREPFRFVPGHLGPVGKQFGAVTQEDAVAAVHAMIDCGVNIVDTAPIYASGGSEEVLGKALQGDTVTRCS